MQSAIKKSSYAMTELAFQSLPRGLRRRAASHNINRLPARLREKAAREAFKSAPGSKLIRKRVRKIKTPKNTVLEFLRRQKSKKWLETHMWHTKRMKMNDIWGYRIASRPNTKSVRVIYRSFTRLSVIHDASYMGCVELKGNTQQIITAINTITDITSASVGSERYIKGNRYGSTHLYEYLGFPTKLICPISFLWKPVTKDTLWLWIHPSAFNEAMTHIRLALEKTNASEVVLNDLRNEILRFELTGPRSTALLQTILDPIEDEAIKGNQLWNDLEHLRTSASLSPGSVIGLVVNDPRLRFPQKVPPRTNEISSEDQRRVQHILENWPEDAANTSIWEEEGRKKLFDTRIAEYGLNLRRENNMIPGTKLEPTPEDSKIPLLLIQRGGPAFDTSNATKRALQSHEWAQGWSLVIPRGFGMAFWKSLVFAGGRVAGYDDMRAIQFESGFPSFPQDYPGTRAFEVHRAQVKNTLESVWQKRPAAKRVNYAKRGVEHPFECAFESLSNVDHMEVEPEHNLSVRPSYALIRGVQLAPSFLSDPRSFDDKLDLLKKKRGLNMEIHLPDPKDALVQVRLKYIDRGKPAMNAMIYLIKDEATYGQCTSFIRCQAPSKSIKRKAKELLRATSDSNKSIPIPSKTEHIGYVTNGDFSLTLGYGFGIGACSISGLREIDALDSLNRRSAKRIVLIRNPSSLEVRPAQVEILF
ncbi:ribonucleases P/MRP protein subunit POP1-domain-containing protein [Choanephora cucurbitarum]|nr:ribonucleases P/MRP protein subunit POP1-domain-containing protein [Choanephora cucurbitarum]